MIERNDILPIKDFKKIKTKVLFQKSKIKLDKIIQIYIEYLSAKNFLNINSLVENVEKKPIIKKS